MKKRTIEVQSIIRADNGISRNWMKIILYTILVVSIALLASFLISFTISDSSIPFTIFSDDFQEYDSLTVFSETVPVIEGMERIFDGQIPEWSVYTFIFAAIGFISYLSFTYMSGAMIFESKSWIDIFQKQGLVLNHSSLRDLIITTNAGKIVISKENLRYKIKMPKLDNVDLTQFGLVRKENSFTAFCSKEELSSLVHIYLSKVN